MLADTGMEGFHDMGTGMLLSGMEIFPQCFIQHSLNLAAFFFRRFLQLHQDISGKLDKSGGQMTGILSGGDGFGWIMNRQGESLQDILGTFPTYLDLDTKADRATTLSGYGITDGATKTELSAAVSTNNPAFVSAVRNTPTENMPEDMPTDWGTYGTVGAVLAALAAFVKWAKAKIVAVIGDDGKPTNQFATDILGKQVAKEAIIYKANTATGLKDRAFNALSLDGTEYNLSTALAAVTPTVENQPRDLLIVATATAATTISFTSGTIKGDKPTIDGSGTWLITLTEYASGVWYCRQIKMEDAA